MAIRNILINHYKKTIGIDIKGNVISFNHDGEENIKLELFKNENKIFDENLSLDDSYGYLLPELEYGCSYKLKINESECEFKTAFELDSRFITTDIENPTFYKEFNVDSNIDKAYLTITGLGIYEAFINNERVGNYLLTPGFNDYDSYLRYQTYDVTDLLQCKNLLEVNLGNGWYKSRFGLGNQENIWGDNYKLCLRLDIIYQNGKEKTIRSDESFKVKSSYTLENGIYDGEVKDYTKEIQDFGYAKFCDEMYNLTPDLYSNIVKKEILNPELIISTKGEYILDFKQNMVGFVKCNLTLDKGQKMILSFGEIMQEGAFYNENYRGAKSTFEVTGDGKRMLFEPSFTFYGFRYVKVEGITNVDPSLFEGIVIYSDLDTTINCQSDDSKINRLILNGLWGQKGNFIDIPTDCPQRDERLGWTGDTQVFSKTAMFNMNSYIFYKKFLRDIRYEQEKYYDGDIPMYVPTLKKNSGAGGAVWADAAIIVPWNMYLFYNDLNILKESYSLMKDYTESLIKKDLSQGNRNLILYGFTFGDWLALDGITPQSRPGGTDNGFIMSVYYYNALNTMSRVTSLLGYNDDYSKYEEKKKLVYNAILDEYFAPNGRLALDTQTSYLLALHFNIYRNKRVIIDGLRNRLKKDFFKLKTGFTGTPLLIPTLLDNGLSDDAYRILYNEKCPGWLFTVNMGATTIWERWNAMDESGKITGTSMNSFNHYANGAVMEGIYSSLVGLKPKNSGFSEIEIKPHLNYRMKSMSFSYNSPQGNISISWAFDDENLKFSVNIPNMKGTLYLFDKEYILKTGLNEITIKTPASLIYPFDLNTPFIDIIENEEAKNTLKEILPLAYQRVTGESEEYLIENGNFMRFVPMFRTTPESLKLYEDALKRIKC